MMAARTAPLGTTLLGVLLACSALAAPRTPLRDDEVVQVLPTRLGDARPQRERLLALRADPGQLPLALAIARDALERARHTGDPREIGPAQAALAPWWSLPAPPPSVRLLRATLRQNQHEFSSALSDLDALADAPPGTPVPLAVRAQAEWTRATLHQVLGNWAQARAGCERLAGATYAGSGPALALTAQVCLAELDSLQGRDPDGAERRLAALQRGAAATGVDTAWLSLVRAELAARRGAVHAEALFRQATADSPGVYALAAYADWLLDQHRERDVLSLLDHRDNADADALLLRRAQARQRLGAPGATDDVAQLQARFDAARQRRDSTHARELSRFELELRGNAVLALELALAHWQRQKEPADALAVLRAAHAAGRPEAARPVRDWARAQGFVDRRWPVAGATS